ncbi:small multi-drug export protein [Candidatus Woesearchaeota archaeon]|nr:small multi-drug export protein [Candidatus Woesearchaeota archaeon]
MNQLLKAIIASLLPISELRGGIPIAVASGYSYLAAFVVCVIANILVIPITFFILDYLHKYLVKISLYKKIIDKSIEKGKRGIENKIGTKWEFIALMLFVGIPLPITGAYTGALIAWFFKLNRKKSYMALSLGVLMAGIIVTLVVLTGSTIFRIFVK